MGLSARCMWICWGGAPGRAIWRIGIRGQGKQNVYLQLCRGWCWDLTEYKGDVITQEFMTYLRRLPTSSPDGSAVVPTGTANGATYWLNYLTLRGGQPEDMQRAILGSAEYVVVASEKAFWDGDTVEGDFERWWEVVS